MSSPKAGSVKAAQFGVVDRFCRSVLGSGFYLCGRCSVSVVLSEKVKRDADARLFIMLMGGAPVVEHLTFATEAVLECHWPVYGESGQRKLLELIKWPASWPHVRRWGDMMDEQKEFIWRRVRKLAIAALHRFRVDVQA